MSVATATDSIVKAPRSLNAYFEGSLDLLRAIGDVLDVRTVFPRVSNIVNEMLPHDALVMAFFDHAGQLVVQAKTGDFPDVTPYAYKLPPADDLIIADLNVQALPVSGGVNPTARLLAAGYRSMMSVSARAHEQLLRVAFWSKRSHAFAAPDVPMARRIVEYIALGVSHECLARAAHPLAEERPRSERMEWRVQSLDDVRARTRSFIVGESQEWQAAIGHATKVAGTDTTVLLTGESGTGKEVMARYIHRTSPRHTGPFIALNCAALPEQLLESELFGYERGAFTSAQQSKPGQIELASGGVLFLDEVSEMSPGAQAKFLRVLQEREFQRLGGTKTLKANIRVVAATNRDLQKAVERGDFREDLYYRLSVFDIRIEPLRERRADIMPLAEAFLQDIARSIGRPPADLTPQARQALLQHTWPGNVRELRNVLERATIVCESGLIESDHLALQTARKRVGALNTDLGAFERETITQVLSECRWNKAKAARRLGLSRTQMYVRMRRHGLEEPPTMSVAQSDRGADRPGVVPRQGFTRMN
jgi:transcriptional regulator with PAS, ATPase and Fis domain